MAKIVTTDRFSGGEGIASNSLDVSYGDLLAIKNGFIDKAVAGDKVEGISAETKVFENDNETVKMSKLQYIRVKDETQFEVATTSTITQANVGEAFNLNSNGIIDAITAGSGDQVYLREVKGEQLGVFVRNK